MLPIQLFRQEKERVTAGLQKKNFGELELVDKIIELDEQRRHVQAENDQLLAATNAASKEIGKLMASGNKEEAEKIKAEVGQNKEKTKDLGHKLNELEKELHDTLVKLPNLPHETVPSGKTPEDNEVVREGGSTPSLDAQKLPHWEITDKYNLIDFELGNKVTGSGFPVYVNKGARLQRALISYFLNYNIDAGYTEYYPPYMVNEESAYGTGQLPDKEGQMYQTQDGTYLIPTAEVPLTNIYRDVIINEQDMPVKMTAFTPCFRREAGSYGKDVRGLNRVHQFDKVEIVQIVQPEKSYEALEEMVAHVENLVQSLGLQYRILRLCGGDMSFASALTYDFEVYSAAQERWLEVSSVSNFEHFQSNRMKIRYRHDGKPQPAHTLNGSSLALPRIMACILENFQTPDGVNVPEALQPYYGSNIIN
ncbi:MAG: serine--tRNA ligase [Chitinophagales bacterium]|nr:serine--tRNA ligase [Chitinophagaceae bacterium]MCB9065317.1 serine--tRNA ligase [Chitinophagales bacterium]